MSNLIDDLVADLQPVRPLRARNGAALTALAVGISIAGVAAVKGLWVGSWDGDASEIFFIVNGLLAILGIVCTVGVLAVASPRIGNRHDGPRWGMAMLGVIPITALAYAVSGNGQHPVFGDPYGLSCAWNALVASSLVAATLVWWLRRGAPVSPPEAGLFAGVAAGSFGSLVYGLSCPIDSITHIGIWHVIPVALCGLIGRIAVPSLVRW
jgi:hypothetical protein